MLRDYFVPICNDILINYDNGPFLHYPVQYRKPPLNPINIALYKTRQLSSNNNNNFFITWGKEGCKSLSRKIPAFKFNLFDSLNITLGQFALNKLRAHSERAFNNYYVENIIFIHPKENFIVTIIIIIIIMVLFYLFIQYYAVLKEISIR